MNFGRDIIFIGVVLVVVGLLISFLSPTSLPKLPGDIYIRKGNFTLYFPWVTSIVVSVVLSLIFYFFFRR